MTFPSSTYPDLPPGTISETPEAVSTKTLPVSSSHLHTHLPTTNVSESASKSFFTPLATPTNAILLTNGSIVNTTSLLSNAADHVSTFNSHSSNRGANFTSASWISRTTTMNKNGLPTYTPPLSSHSPVFAQNQRVSLDENLSNVSLSMHRESTSINSSVTRGDDFTGPVVLPVVDNLRDVTLRQRQTTISSLTQLGASAAAEEDSKLSQWSTENSLRGSSNSSSSEISSSISGYLLNVTSGPLNSLTSGLRYNTDFSRSFTSNSAAVDKINSSRLMSHLGVQITPFRVDLLATRLPNVSTNLLKNDLSIKSSMPSITSVAPTTLVPDEKMSADYQADVYDIFTEDYVASTLGRNATSGNGSTDLDLPSLRKKFLFQFTNKTTSAVPNTTPVRYSTPLMAQRTTAYRSTLPISDPLIDEDPLGFAESSIDNSTSDYITSSISYTTPSEEMTAPILLSRNVTFAANVTSTTNVTTAINTTSAANVTSNVSHKVHKEQLQFPGITLKVSHVLIPKQKRSRYPYNIQNMKIELPKTESLNKAPPSVPKTSKNSNCTRFPVLVVTAADTESKEKVNLTEERYDCEFSSQIQSSTQQKDPVDRIRTYYGGYVFRYTIPKASNGSNSTNYSSTEVVRTTDMTTAEDGDDYYPSYGEYLELANGSSNSGKT